jgi:hypothetical protein
VRPYEPSRIHEEVKCLALADCNTRLSRLHLHKEEPKARKKARSSKTKSANLVLMQDQVVFQLDGEYISAVMLIKNLTACPISGEVHLRLKDVSRSKAARIRELRFRLSSNPGTHLVHLRRKWRGHPCSPGLQNASLTFDRHFENRGCQVLLFVPEPLQALEGLIAQIRFEGGQHHLVHNGEFENGTLDLRHSRCDNTINEQSVEEGQQHHSLTLGHTFFSIWSAEKEGFWLHHKDEGGLQNSWPIQIDSTVADPEILAIEEPIFGPAKVWMALERDANFHLCTPGFKLKMNGQNLGVQCLLNGTKPQLVLVYDKKLEKFRSFIIENRLNSYTSDRGLSDGSWDGLTGSDRREVLDPSLLQIDHLDPFVVGDLLGLRFVSDSSCQIRPDWKLKWSGNLVRSCSGKWGQLDRKILRSKSDLVRCELAWGEQSWKVVCRVFLPARFSRQKSEVRVIAVEVGNEFPSTVFTQIGA